MSTSDSHDGEVVFITRKWAPATGGMETYSMKLTEALREHVPVTVIALPGRANGMPPGALSLMLFPFTVLRRLAALKSTPRVLHLGDMALWPLGLFARRGTRVVISAHGTDVAYHRRGGLKARLYGAYLKLGSSLLRSAKVLANSRATQEVLAETGWRTARVIPLASDVAPAARTEGHDGTILFAGRLVARKGCGWFIDNVLPHLPQTIHLQVAGSPWDRAEAARLDNPRVTFLGPRGQSELASLYASCLCVIVPNIDLPNGEYEGFGLVAPEAAACGGVVLAADSGGLADAVIDGETGFLLPPGDASAWRDKIVELAGWDTSARQEFTGAAMAKAREVYSWERVAGETLAVYDA